MKNLTGNQDMALIQILQILQKNWMSTKSKRDASLLSVHKMTMALLGYTEEQINHVMYITSYDGIQEKLINLIINQ